MNHNEAIVRVLTIVKVYNETDFDWDATVDRLEGLDYSSLQVNLQFDLLQIAFGWAVLKKMGVASFPSTFVLRNDDVADREVPVASSHIFTVALGLALDVFEYGYTEHLSQSVFTTICNGSAEVGALSKALHKTPKLELSKVKVGSPIMSYTLEEYLSSA